ncbi:PKD domain-containing protein [Actinosynnema sp. NPDC051121]
MAALLGLLGLLVPGVAYAAPPANDDFDQAVPVTTPSFTTTQSAVEATQGADDPTTCYGFHHSVWFTYTAPADGVLTATTAGSGYDTVLSAFTGSRGSLSQVGCNDDAAGTPQSRVEFPVVTGTRYHFMVSAYRSGSVGSLTFSVTGPGTPAPANDAFADAEPVTSLPRAADVDLSTATAEPGEPGSVCGQSPKSVWYAVTLPATTPVTLSPSTPDGRLTVYTGPAQANLTEVGCTWSGAMTFRADAGTTYSVRLTAGTEGASAMRLLMDVAHPIRAAFSHDPETPSTFVDTEFRNTSTVPDVTTPVTVQWDFGDGTTGTGPAARHRYRVDGDYTATLTVAAGDGRTATTSQVVVVRTHDVTISGFTTPSAATAGTTKAINVRVANTRYAEDVTVTLYRSTPSGWSEVGHYAQYVPASATGAVNFPFNYTFRPDDAAVGKVNFRAVATAAVDDQPGDNEVISATTLVRQAATRGLDVA